jgi:2-polyprenyl-6-hydroxyphenyl methylase/3-demethylubiquinone-9 3-methyltransferase
VLTGAAMDRILARYPHATPFQRWHMRSRLRLCPYDLLLPHLTGKGNLLDVGCGFGHLAWYLEDAKPGLGYFGSDIDARKIALAQGSSLPASGKAPVAAGPAQAGVPRFALGDVRSLAGLPPEFGNIVFLDVLYLMPWDLQREMMAWALGRLASEPGSALVIKTMDEAKGFSGFRAVAEEWIMVSLLRRTASSGALNGARPAADYLGFAASLGFRGECHALGTFNPSSVLRFHR